MKNCIRRFPVLFIAITVLVPSVKADEPGIQVAARRPFGQFDKATDIGPVRKSGSTVFDPDRQTYELAGAGTNMWADKDECHMVWKKLDGDFVLEAQVKLQGDGVDPHRKLGWIIRKSLDADSAYADVAVHGDGLTSLQYRRSSGAKTEEVKSTVKAPDLIRLSRTGTKIQMAAATSGTSFQTSEGIDLDLGNQVYVGLFICSHNADVVEKGIFSKVRITPGTTESSGK
jgi:hypothetical protein